MSRKLFVAILMIALTFLGLFLWKAIVWKPIASMDIIASLETTGLQSSHVGNNSVSFEMSPNSEGDFTILIENNGTVPLEGGILYIDQISSGICLSRYYDFPYGISEDPPSFRFLGNLDKTDSTTHGWKILSPSESGSYEAVFRVVSDKVSYWFTVVITVL